MPIVQVPEVLRDKLGADGAKALVDLLNQAGREARDEVILLAEERFSRRLAEELRGFEGRLTEEVGALRQGMSDLEARLRQGMSDLEARLRQGMSDLEVRVVEGIAGVEGRVGKAEGRVLRWSFGFWAAQFVLLLGAILGTLFAFFK